MKPLRWPRFWFAVGLLGLILVTLTCLIPLPDGLPSPPGEDLTLHLLAWTGLSGWFAQMAHGASRWRAAFILWLWSLGIEGAQSLTLVRTAEWGDALANTAGVLMGLLMGSIVGRRLLLWLENRLSPTSSRD